MDPSRCDRLARAAGTRRAALGLLAARAAGGGPVAAGRSKKQKCRPACAPCWRCARGTCRPTAGGARCLGGVCRGGSCVACGGQLQPCCADDRCTQGDCDMFGFCGACAVSCNLAARARSAIPA